MQTYIVDIAGEPVTLPIVPINQKLAISLLMVIDMGVTFGERIGKALADHLRPLKPDIIVGAATLGIPVVIEVSRALRPRPIRHRAEIAEDSSRRRAGTRARVSHVRRQTAADA